MNSSSKRTIAVTVALIAGITLLIWAGVHNARQRRLDLQRDQDAQAARAVLVPARGSADNGADANGSSMTPKMQGKTAPAFSLVDLDGKKVSLSDFKGKPVLVNFWATWCGPCKIEMPWFEEFNKKYAAQGLILLGISTDDIGKTTVASTAHKLGVTYPILLKDDKVENAYGGVDMLPQSFYIGRDGKIVLETAGMTEDAGGKDEIEANIKKLLAAGGQ